VDDLLRAVDDGVRDYFDHVPRTREGGHPSFGGKVGDLQIFARACCRRVAEEHPMPRAPSARSAHGRASMTVISVAAAGRGQSGLAALARKVIPGKIRTNPPLPSRPS
jgi:hypothetical protein